jgi:guanylate kinase
MKKDSDMSRGILFIITAPSGCGKGSLRRAVVSCVSNMKFCPSITTRAPRPGERHGVDYIFLSGEEFARRRESGALVEWANVYGNFYGTPGDEIESWLAQGVDVILEKDVQGAATLRKVYPEGIFIFILPPSLEELRRRIEGRGTENERDKNIRLNAARQEISDLSAYDYVIINSDLERAKDRLLAIVAGERARRPERGDRELLPPRGIRRAGNDKSPATRSCSKD